MNRRVFLCSLAGMSLRASDSLQHLLMPTDTPDELGFRIMWYNPAAALDRGTYRLKIAGLVDRPQSFSLEELRRLPQETQSSRLQCVQGWSSRTQWGGLRFAQVLDIAKPKSTARAVRLDCADKWFEYFSLDDILSPRVMLALDMAGKPLPDRHGGPIRLIDPSRYGYKSAKLVTSITFVETGKGSMAVDLGPYYTPGGEIQAGYDHPLDLGQGIRKRHKAGEVTDY